MAISTGTLSVPDFAGAERKLKTQDDSADGSKNPAHPQLNAAGAIINPATAENQAAANAALAAIADSAAASATAGKQDTGNAALAQIATNTALGSLNFAATPTITAGAYTAGMVLGGKIPVAGAARAVGGGGLVQQAFVGKKAALTAPLDLLVFHTDPAAAFADHAALPDISADLGKLAGVIRCTDVVDCGTPQLLQAAQQALQYRTAADSTTLYVVPVVRGAETYPTTSAVTIALGLLRD